MTESTQKKPSLLREFVRDMKNWGTVAGIGFGLCVVFVFDKATFAGAPILAKLMIATLWALICGIIWSQRKHKKGK